MLIKVGYSIRCNSETREIFNNISDTVREKRKLQRSANAIPDCFTSPRRRLRAATNHSDTKQQFEQTAMYRVCTTDCIPVDGWVALKFAALKVPVLYAQRSRPLATCPAAILRTQEIRTANCSETGSVAAAGPAASRPQQRTRRCKTAAMVREKCELFLLFSDLAEYNGHVLSIVIGIKLLSIEIFDKKCE